MNKKTLLIVSTFSIAILTSCNFENKNSGNNKEAEIELQEIRQIYTPYGLDITHGNWHWKYARINEFEDFTVTLTNKTREDFKMVKYRLKVFVKENGVKTEVFSKSYEYYQRLNAGDVIRIPVYDLTQFYMGVNVSQEDNWTWTGYIEDSEVVNK
jgi:hypothetical protein